MKILDWITKLFRGEPLKVVAWEDIRLVPYREAEKLLADGFVIYTPEEDRNSAFGVVWLARKVSP